MPAKISLVGQKFGRLKVISDLPSVREGSLNWFKTYSLCLCDCGAKLAIRNHSISSGHAKSCGCYHKDVLRKMSTTHGHTSGGKKTPEWVCWNSMIQRCHNPKHKYYGYYGARGIKVCRAWLESYSAFFKHTGPRPAGHSLDRWPNKNGNYEPGNVRWATKQDQQRNMRSNVNVKFRGRTMCASAWDAELGFPRSTVANRIKAGCSIKRALTKPSR